MDLLDELFLFADEEVWRLFVVARLQGLLLLETTLDLLLLLLTQLLRNDLVLLHEVQKLARNLLKGLFGQQPGVVLEFIEGNELDDVACHLLLESLGIQGDIVRVQHVHFGEVGVSNTNDDDGERQRASSHNLVNGLLHV